jgi:hypothetical protein
VFGAQGQVTPTKVELIGLRQSLTAELAREQLSVFEDGRFQPLVAMLPDERGQFVL